MNAINNSRLDTVYEPLHMVLEQKSIYPAAPTSYYYYILLTYKNKHYEGY